MIIFETVNDDIKKAMLARDKVRLETLRGMKKEFIEAMTAKGASGELTDEAAITILQRMVKQRKDSAEIFTTQGRQDLAVVEIAQLGIIQEYLPKQLSAEELETEIRRIIAETGASSMKEMGKVMGAATKQLAGKTEGRLISEMVKKLLS